jgi:peptide chain release factor subunit 1
MWRVKNLIARLEAARGNGTSMISLIIPPGDQISKIANMLATESGTASNIKSRVNRLPVCAWSYYFDPAKIEALIENPSQLVLYCGTIATEDGKEKKEMFDMEPFKPTNTSLYLCDRH